MLLGLGQEKYKLSLEHHVVPESKDALRKMTGACRRDVRAKLKGLPMAKAGAI